jgi:hypothetical protein
MPKRVQLLSELQHEHDYGILLTAQVGGVPHELQLLIETAVFDESVQGLRPRGAYIIRALGVREHRITLGVFGSLAFLREHILLYHHNSPHLAVDFEGTPARLFEAALDVSQAYASTYGPWRHLTEIGADLNRAKPLVDLLASGKGLLGVMPKPLAERMEQVLTHHGLCVSMQEAAVDDAEHAHGHRRTSQLLLIDQSFVIAEDFSVEILGKT